VTKLREKLAARGARGIIGLQRVFKILDDNGNGTLEIQEFWKGLCDFRLKFNQDECRKLFDLFDANDDGVLDFDELIQAIKGQMSPSRKEIVKKAFNKMDGNSNGVLEIDDIRQSYNALNHPDVKSRKKTEEEVLQEFLETFEAHRQMTKGDVSSIKGDGKVTLNEFMDYYSNISASIDDDEYFKLMMTNAWNLDNKSYGKAWG
jgi:Ca2+-binding EF-hand superfamily protein